VSREVAEKQHVVIVGAGFGGVKAAAELKAAGIPFTIIDPKEYFHYLPGALRAAVNPDFTKQIAIPLKEVFGDSFIQGKVEGINVESKKVSLLEGLGDLEYTHLVLAVGNTGSPPSMSKEVTAEGLKIEMDQFGENIEKASKIVIVGGGPVGIEMAGEILDRYKDKKITLVHSREQFLDLGDKFSNNTKAMLEAAGVELRLGRKVQNLKDLTPNVVKTQSVVLDNGDSLEADLVIPCIGFTPQNELLNKVFSSEFFDEHKRIKVDPYLEVCKLNDVFAIGDCCDTDEHKMAAHANNHGALVADNIIRSITGQAKKPYKQAFVGMVVTFGEKTGVGVFNGWHLPAFVCSKLKGRDLFVGKHLAELGIKQPAS